MKTLAIPVQGPLSNLDKRIEIPRIEQHLHSQGVMFPCVSASCYKLWAYGIFFITIALKEKKKAWCSQGKLTLLAIKRFQALWSM